MKIKRSTMLGLCTILFLSMLVACSNGKDTQSGVEQKDTSSGESQENKDVTITFFNTSAEVNKVFEDLFAKYHELHPNVTVELIPTPVGGAQIQKFQSLLASGTPATVVNLDAGTILQYIDKFLVLESEKAKYKKLTKPGVIESVLLDGKFVGVPWSAQGYGLLYNTRVVEEALGEPFDPDMVTTRNELEDLFKKIKAAGKTPMLITGADWSLGSHYLGLFYSLQSETSKGDIKFVKSLINGDANLTNNKVFNGLMDTFDLLKKYNLHKNNPVAPNAQKDMIAFAKGKTAFYFMGDWTWSTVGQLEERDDEFGILPVPVSNDPSDYGNSRIAYSAPKLFAIDDSGSTPAQQEAAKKLIEWMVTSEQGQKTIVTKMGLNMPFKNVKAKSTNVMAKAVSQYVDQGKTINLSVTWHFPQDYWSKTGASMQKYLAGQIDRKKLAQEIEDYWESQDKLN